MIADPAVAEGVHNPAVATASRESAITKGLGSSVSAPVLNLILLMVRRGRIEDLSSVAAEFRRLDDQRNGVTHAVATTASPLEPSEIKQLTDPARNDDRRKGRPDGGDRSERCSAASSSGSATA